MMVLLGDPSLLLICGRGQFGDIGSGEEAIEIAIPMNIFCHKKSIL